MRTTSPLRPSSRDAILEAAIRLFVTDPGASLGDVAALAGVGRATLHRHFGSREALIRELTLLSIREIDEAVMRRLRGTETAGDILERMFEAIVPLGDRFRFLSWEGDALDDPEIARGLERQYGQLTLTIEAAKSEGTLDPEVPTAWVVKAIDGLLYAAWASSASGEISAAEASSLSYRTLVDGLGKR